MIDLYSLLLCLVILYILVNRGLTVWSREVRFLFGLLILANSFYFLLLFIEWSQISAMADPLEDVIGAMLPLMWAIFLYGFNQEKNEAELEKSRDQAQVTFDLAATGIAHIDPEGNFIRVNDALCRMLDYTREELLRKKFTELTPKEDNRLDLDLIKRFRKRQVIPGKREKQYFRKDGTQLWASVNLSGLYTKDGTLDYLIVMIDDITKSKRTELELRKYVEDLSAVAIAGQRLQQLEDIEGLNQDIIDILETVCGFENVAVLLREENGDTLIPYALSDQGRGRVNIESEKEFVRSRHITIGDGIVGWVARYGETQRIGDVKKDQRYFSLRPDIQSELCVPIKTDDQIIGVINVESPRLDAYTFGDQQMLESIAGQLAVTFENARLFEQIKDSSRKLEEALKKAEQADKVKTLFMANMSHEIRTPLNAILGFTDLIEQTTKDFLSPEQHEFFTLIRHSGKRLMNTVHGVLDISQIESGTFKLEPVKLDLKSLVGLIVKGLKSEADEKGLRLDYICFEKTAIIRADEYCVTGALTNLIHNSIKYTEKGRIDVTLQNKETEIQVVITDTGIGMSNAFQTNLFAPFTQESTGYTKQFQGVGLGLALTKRYLDLNGAEIGIVSEQGKGTRVTVNFPLE